MKTSELQGAALDWAVAKAEGFEPFTDGISWIVDDSGTYKQLPKYSADWAQGGPIIERERIELRDYGGDQWAAYDHLHPVQTGPTPLIAAMRSYVASKLGDEIELPESYLDHEGTPNGQAIFTGLEAAREAIAKATGEA